MLLKAPKEQKPPAPRVLHLALSPLLGEFKVLHLLEKLPGDLNLP